MSEHFTHKMADRDLLFAVRNNFYLGAYNTVIQEGSDLETLSDAEKIDRDVYVYRSYVALGSYEVRSSGSVIVSRHQSEHT